MKMVTKMPLSWLLDVQEAFEWLETFLLRLEPAVERIIGDQRLLAEQEPFDPEDPTPYESYRAELFEQVLPRTVRYSTVMHAHAALDVLLAKLCDHTQRALKLPFGRSDMKNDTLQGRLDYLRRALADDLAQDAFHGPFLGKLRAFSQIRNCIAHAQGELRGSNNADQIRAAATQLGIETMGGYLEIRVETVTRVLKEAEGWVLAAIDSVDKALERRRSADAK